MSDASYTDEQYEQLFGDRESTDCTECGEPLDSVEMEALQRMCFACAMLRQD